MTMRTALVKTETGNLQCKDCAYYWREEDEKWPRCHYESLGTFDPAPCEIEYEPDEEPDYDFEDEFDDE